MHPPLRLVYHLGLRLLERPLDRNIFDCLRCDHVRRWTSVLPLAVPEILWQHGVSAHIRRCRCYCYDQLMGNRLYVWRLPSVHFASSACRLFLFADIGLHSIFGAFILGIVLPREGTFLLQVAEKLEDVILALFLPIYFISSGLKTDIGTLSDGKSWGFVVLVTLVAAGSKIIGCGTMARICGMTTRESFTLGVMMNSKGLVELIVLSA